MNKFVFCTLNLVVLFDYEGDHLDLWCSTEGDSSLACGMALLNNYDGTYVNRYSKSYGYSVRCVKD